MSAEPWNPAYPRAGIGHSHARQYLRVVGGASLRGPAGPCPSFVPHGICRLREVELFANSHTALKTSIACKWWSLDC